MNFKRLHISSQFKRLHTNPEVVVVGVDIAEATTDQTVFQFRRSHKVVAQVMIKDMGLIPDFIYYCGNVINDKKRIVFRMDVPYPSLFCCSECPLDIKKQCRAYDWAGEGWK